MLQRLLSLLKKQPLNPEKQSEDLLGSSTDTNLIAGYGIAAKENEAKKAVLFLKISLTLLTVAYLFSILFNQILNNQLNAKKIAIQDSYNKVIVYKDLETTAHVIEKKLEVYQKISDNRSGLSGKMDAVYSSVDPTLGINILKLVLNSGNFSVTLSGKQVADFSKIIYALLYTKTHVAIKSVSIKSAIFDTRSDSYVVVIEGAF